MTGLGGAIALVTGAASGIGLALCRGLVERGARVWLTDLDGDAARAAAERLGSGVRGARLDVRDAAAFARLVEDVAADRGRLDYLFNNAGIAVAGETHELGLEHFQATLDVNLRGVVHGIAAAYPLMVAQGHGHLVQTASAAGLLPVPLMSAYAMSKHAVVGLSRSLRHEAAAHGVRVTALCPTAIDTPLLDGENPAGAATAWRPDLRRYLTRLAGPPMSVEDFAERALRGVERNRELVVAPARARAALLLARFAPALLVRHGRSVLAETRATRRSS